jgi:hypothetical protein
MRNHRRYAFLTPVLVLVLTLAAPTVEAGGGVSMHLGSGGFGVSVGFGDWGVYTRSWSDPYWSIDFNATLAGYGQWVSVSGLGRVWRPWVAASWRPYTHGRWVSTGFGMTWVAYEPWGYVPHHYGSWAYASFGWVWVPGYSYSCANVVWVGSGGHVGWYARPPWGWSHAKHGFRHGYRHGFRDGYDNGYSDGWHDARYATYVDWRHFGSDNVSRHAVTHRIASKNHIKTRAKAPSRDEIRQRGDGAIVTETRLSRRSVKVNGREVTIARPEGVARSIERYAADTVGNSLSEEALKQRQPLVRARTASTASATSSSRSAGVSRDARPAQARHSTREPSASRSDRTASSSRSTQVRPSGIASASTRTDARSSTAGFAARQGRDDSRQPRPRTSRESGSNDDTRSAKIPAASARTGPRTGKRQVAQRPQQTSEALRSSPRIERSSTDSRRSRPAQGSAGDSRRSKSRTDPPATARKKQDSEEKTSKESSRKRRR